MTTVNELILDRNLLDKDFEGYKLSLSPVPVFNKDIQDVDILNPNEDQYSFLHHREFSLHNHLYADPWNKDVVYFFNAEHNICRSWMNEHERLEKIINVWELPSNSSIKLLNPSLCFASPQISVVSDGSGRLYILETSSRSDIVNWKILYTEDVLEESMPFKIIDARCTGEFPNRNVECLLIRIDASCDPVDLNKENSKFQTVLNWVVFSEEMTDWSKNKIKSIENKGALDYGALEPDCTGVYLISSSPFASEDELNAKNEVVDDKKPNYYWNQTFEDIKIWFMFENLELSDVKVSTTEDELKINIKGENFLTGKLHQAIDPLLTIWELRNSKVEVTLQKLVQGSMWTKLMDADKIGLEILDEKSVDETHNKLAHLCSDKEEKPGQTVLNTGHLEECDAFDDSRLLVRYDTNGHQTHKVIIGGQQWLFKMHISDDKPPAFCVRNDVDGCVWLPQKPSDVDQTWKCDHIGTFLAFGYIQASKVNKKFTVAPPDMSYIAIVDVTGHVLLYRKGIAVAGQLRNRKTGQNLKEIAVQNLINLQTKDEIVGAHASDKYCFVLTKKNLHVVHIC